MVRVSVSSGNQDCCLLTVTDEGIGMTEEQAAHIFDRFYRVDASNTAVKGVGLGMSIVRNIVHAHGGEILVESQPDIGTTIYVSLPFKAPSQSPQAPA
jgi:signal transduction histidine kinase